MSHDLIFEIGTEELPASFIGPATQVLAEAWKKEAAALRISFGDVETHGTPRRVALLVKGIAEKAEDFEERGEGPAVSQAFDAEGKPTKAAEGFAKKWGTTADQLQRAQTPQGERLVAFRKTAGQPTIKVLPDLLGKLIPELAKNKKSMRWGTEEASFPRPVRWIGAVFGGEVLPVKFADVQASGNTFGHRFLAPQAIRLTSCDEYLPKLREAKVLAAIPERRQRVVEEIDRVAKEAGGRRVVDEELVDTIAGLVEWPSGVLGSFGADALDMPREVLVSEMRGHQKYASIETLDGKLMPAFVAVANTPVKDVAVSRRGYERVLRARLSDARYFFNEDQTRALGDRVAELRRVTFQERLGSVHDKLERMLSVAKHLVKITGRSDTPTVERATFLCKADLTTGMVGEFPDLQGAMGREYARKEGEPEEVALAIFEHYLPRGAADTLPSGDAGAIVGIADRIDTITGIFAIDKAPTGANDAFGLRRACLGIIRVLLDKGYRLKLGDLVDSALERHYHRFASLEAPKPDAKGKKPALLDRAAARTQVLEFFRGRLKSMWSDDHAPDVVEAVLSVGYEDVVDANARLQALSEIKRRADWLPLASAFGRASNIIEKQAKDLQAGPVDPALFKDAPEGSLHSAWQSASALVAKALPTGDYGTALRALAELRPAVDLFFDKVLVMAEDPALKQNRLRLVRGVQQLFAPIADFARIQTK
jgi:glycyl-tRNA synthetase beta chain